MPASVLTVLVLGARGRFGLAAALAFRQAGWRVVAQMRPGALPPNEAPNDAHADAQAPAQPGIEWLNIDLHDTQALAQAGRGACVVVHALNPSAYTAKAWRREVLPVADAAIGLARALNATLMVPGNVYNFGAGMPSRLREDTPQNASTVKGQIRTAMEQRLRASGVQTVVIRAGDFFGSGRNSWFDMFIVKNIRKGRVTYPGNLNVPTAWAYLPDLARCFAAVAAKRAQLQAFEVLHFGGYSATGQQWLDALNPVAQTQGWVQPGGHLKFSQLPWPMLRLGALVVPTLASLLEMRYLWDTPHALVNERLTALIGPEPHTPLEIAAQQSLVNLGLLAAPQSMTALAAA